MSGGFRIIDMYYNDAILLLERRHGAVFSVKKGSLMKNFVFAVIAGLLLASCNSQASAPDTPVASEAVTQYAQVVMADSSQALGDVVYYRDGRVRRVDNVSEFESTLSAMVADNELAKIDRVVERAETPEYAAAVNDSYDGTVTAP